MRRDARQLQLPPVTEHAPKRSAPRSKGASHSAHRLGGTYKQAVVPPLFYTFCHRFLASRPLKSTPHHASSPHFQDQPQPKSPLGTPLVRPFGTIMANNMDSFDFDALDSAALDETLSFLNNYDPTPLPDPSFRDFGVFGEPMMDWPVVENALPRLGNADLSGGMTNALTDNSLPGSHFPNPAWGVQSGPYQQHQAMEAETPLDFGQSR